MVNISIITSVYRGAGFLPIYFQRLARTAQQLPFELEVIVVANEPTAEEKQLLAAFQPPPNLRYEVIECERETLYASWNRGVRASSGQLIGPWNIDDVRYPAFLVEAVEAFHQGADLIDAAYIAKIENHSAARTEIRSPYDPRLISPRLCVGPFFLFSRQFYEKAGGFDENFRIAADFEWGARETVRQSNYQILEQHSGEFIIHGSNLSNGTNPLEWVEINAVLLRHALYGQLRPVDPALMQQAWAIIGAGYNIPVDIENWLWGEGAQERYERYQQERAAHPWVRRVRLALARRGLVHSTEWDVHHSPVIRKAIEGGLS